MSGYRSLRDVVVRLGRLTVVTGPNGAGKSNLYRALRLLSACGQGRVVGALAAEGGLASCLWAGPATLGGARRGHPVEGTIRRTPISLLLGVAGGEPADLGYLVDLGIPVQRDSAFDRDPHIKREVVFTGPVMRPSTIVAKRRHGSVDIRDFVGGWRAAEIELPPHRSLLAEYADPGEAPELWRMRHQLRSWRFYDGFRTDPDAPARRPQVGTRTTVLADDGTDLAAAVQTILESGQPALGRAVADAFDGAELGASCHDGVFDLALRQPGMLRPLRAAELSDGTLRYLLWAVALLTPEPPPLLVINEPETSLHPSLLPPLARLIAEAATQTQAVVVTHSQPLVDELDRAVSSLDSGMPVPPAPGVSPPMDYQVVTLTKEHGETRVEGQGLLTTPAWEWGRR